MAPSDPNAKPHSPVKHRPLLVMSPAGEKTFSVECSAGDFKTSEIFETKHQAMWSRASPSMSLCHEELLVRWLRRVLWQVLDRQAACGGDGAARRRRPRLGRLPRAAVPALSHRA